MLNLTLRHRFVACLGALILYCARGAARFSAALDPRRHQGEFNLDLTLPIGTPLAAHGRGRAKIDEMVRTQPDVERTAVTVGAEESATTQ